MTEQLVDKDWYDNIRKTKATVETPKAPEVPAEQPVTNAVLHEPGHVCACRKRSSGEQGPVGHPGEPGPRLLGVVGSHTFAWQYEKDGTCELSDAACKWFFAAMEYFKMRLGAQRTRCFYYVDDEKDAPCVAEVAGSLDSMHDNAVPVTLYRWQPEAVANEAYLLRTACHEAMHLLLGDYCILALLDRRDKHDKWNDVLRTEHGVINVLMDCLTADDFWDAAPKFPLDEKAAKKIIFAKR